MREVATPSATLPVLIAGAGIAGLSTALCLTHRNIPCEIIEKRDASRTEGAGIQITPNALRVLSALGLAPEVKARALAPHSIEVNNGRSGARIVTMPLGDGFASVHAAPYLVIRRQHLVDILRDAAEARGLRISYATAFTSEMAERRDIIGADGVWSTVRPLINASDARFTGRIAFRALISHDRLPDWARRIGLSLWLGPDAHAVAYPIERGGTLNIVAIIKTANHGQRWSEPASNQAVLKHFADWNTPLQDLIAAADGFLQWPLYTVDPTASWSRRNIALIGDAAHAMVPFLAQGGAMAIEDAAVIAAKLAECPDRPAAFSAYEQARKKRVIAVWREANQNGLRYHWKGAFAEARNRGLKALGGQRLLDRYRWIYDWTPPL